ncbi:MAG TPA: tetratricopeptide repeat protein [Chloroflexia bacterium]|nr:tetratricopeptide repeat protein [Chloroflexia bacterium]
MAEAPERTFLFTDIEGSTRLWEAYPETMRQALAAHDSLLRTAISAHRGTVFKTGGDAFYATFPDAATALRAALAAQSVLVGRTWPDLGALRVRMALHCGPAQARDGDYYGPTLNRLSRLIAAGHGGQVLLSQEAWRQVVGALPPGVTVRDLGERRLKDLVRAERIFQVLAAGLPTDFPPLRSLDAFQHNLPVQLTSFVGRDRDLAEATRLLDSARVLTLTGPGGAGKTRLAVQVGAEVLDRFPDGVWLVELGPIADPLLVPHALAATLGLREEAGQPLTTALAAYLGARKALVVLDNCEHLVDACAHLVEALVRTCPGLRFLVTSREALGLAGEIRLSVPPLPTPDPRQLPPPAEVAAFDSVRLFSERAVTVLPSFAVTAANAGDVAKICARLDGIPLALELAAARVAVLPVAEIARGLDDRFRLRTSGGGPTLPHQQTLRALLDWSWDLLLDDEQLLFRRLAVFAGGWTLAAVEAVVPGDWSARPAGNGTARPRRLSVEHCLDLLFQLVNKSLVVADEEAGGETRFRLLGTMRAYAAGRLAEAGEAATGRARQRAWVLRFAEEAEGGLRGPQQGVWLARLETEHDNLRAALGGAIAEGEAASALRMVGAVWPFWLTRGYLSEGRHWLEAALALANPSDLADWKRVRARALNGAGNLLRTQQDHSAAAAVFEVSLRLRREVGDEPGIAESLHSLGLLASIQGDYGRARLYFEESLALARGIGDQQRMAGALNSLGNVALGLRDGPAARALFEQSLEVAQQSGDQHSISVAVHNLGNVRRTAGDLSGSAVLFEQSLQLARQLGDKSGMAAALRNLGSVALACDDPVAAQGYFLESLALFEALGDRSGMARCVAGLAARATCGGSAARAALLFGAVDSLHEQTGLRLLPADQDEYDGYLAAARAALDPPAWASAWSAGRRLSVDAALALARAP